MFLHSQGTDSGRMFACVDAKPGPVAPSLGMKLAYVGEES